VDLAILDIMIASDDGIQLARTIARAANRRISSDDRSGEPLLVQAPLTSISEGVPAQITLLTSRRRYTMT
jgi:CheY-like chemotaxis protein